MTASVITKSQRPFLGKCFLTATIVLETGLHIGAGEENLNIGGIDKLVIRDPITRCPYLPGSSIKGKLRSILERLLPNKSVNRSGGSGVYRYESDDLIDGYTEINRNGDDLTFIKFQGAQDCEISRLFGSTGVKCWVELNQAIEQKLEILNRDDIQEIETGKSFVEVKGRNAPARLIVRDCHIVNESIKKLEAIDTGLFMTEWKFENGLDRITAAANPRQIERVPAGAEFKFEMVYNVENKNQAEDDLKNIAIALAILEDDALGGHGSRGYGKIKFKGIELTYRPREWYQGSSKDSVSVSFKDIEDMLKRFGTIKDSIPKLLLGEQ